MQLLSVRAKFLRDVIFMLLSYSEICNLHSMRGSWPFLSEIMQKAGCTEMHRSLRLVYKGTYTRAARLLIHAVINR